MVVACAGGSSAPRIPPPTGLAYPTTALWLQVGADIGSLSPQLSGAAATAVSALFGKAAANPWTILLTISATPRVAKPIV
jgi:hypothetical protein